MKKHTDVLREYVRRLNDDDLRYIGLRLAHRLEGDMAEVIGKVQNHTDIDKWLASATSADDFFDMMDQLEDYVFQEMKRRFTTVVR